MKIVHIITRLILGGAQENTLITCRELAQRGHDVTLITGPAIGNEGHLFLRTENAPYKTIVIEKMIRQIHPVYDPIVYIQLKSILKKINPDIVHTHSAKAGILGRLAAWSIKKKSKIKKPKVIHTIHGLAFHDYQRQTLNSFYKAIERYTAKRTDAFISVADTMTKKALQAKMGNPQMYTTAYSAIDEQDYLKPISHEELAGFRRKYNINTQSIVLVTIARLAPLKGHEFIIESAKELAKKHENCTWLFIGDGQLTDKIKSKIQLAGLGYRFKFTGLLPTDQIPLAVNASDILVHTSLREGLARVLPQAMLCGKPVVSFNIDGAPEVVDDETGFLVEPKNVSQIVNACSKLIENPQLRQKIGENGRRKVIKKFNPQTMLDTIEGVYKNDHQ